MQIITGFHAIEESLRSGIAGPCRLLYNRPGPRVKKILDEAKKQALTCTEAPTAELDRLTERLSETARDHRGVVLVIEGDSAVKENIINFDAFIASFKKSSGGADETAGDEKKRTVVLILDSITDPHNAGAVLRSCDQFGVDLVVLPERRSAKSGGVVLRSSAGAAAWVPTAIVPNLVRAAELLKDAGFWVYGAEAGGGALADFRPSERTVLVMGSEGTGISRLLKETCDGFVSIETCGKLDSLNVSVAAGILLYEICNPKPHSAV